MTDPTALAEALLPCEPFVCGPGCGGDHRADLTGLDDGPPLRVQRKKAAPKSDSEYAEIRSRAWATRRQKYGEHGHR